LRYGLIFDANADQLPLSLSSLLFFLSSCITEEHIYTVDHEAANETHLSILLVFQAIIETLSLKVVYDEV